jgi:hypothetical protein
MRLPILLTAFLLLLLAACSSDSTGPEGPPPGNTNSITATIDGQAFAASPLTIQASANTSQLKGGLIFAGSTITQPSRALLISLGRISGPGTYPLGVNTGTNAGGTLSLVVGSETWWTPLMGDEGTITITSMDGGRVRGTFTATLQPLAGTSSEGTIEVTNGAFNVPINPGYTAPAADDRGSLISGTIGGDEFHGATVQGFAQGGTVIISASTDEYLLTINMSPAEVGTLPLGGTVPLRTVAVAQAAAAGGGSWGTLQGSSGTVTISGLTANRIQGSTTVTLTGTGGGGTIAVDLDFDVRTAQ